MRVPLFGDGEYVDKAGNRVSVRTGCISWSTAFQGLVLSVVCTPLAVLFNSEMTWEGVASTAVGMFVAPLLMDAVKPVHTYHVRPCVQKNF